MQAQGAWNGRQPSLAVPPARAPPQPPLDAACASHPCPPPAPLPQIDRADGSADLATQLASQMNLGGAGDPRAPVRV